MSEVTLSRDFGGARVVVHCNPVDTQCVQDMLNKVPEGADIYDALAQVMHPPVNTAHIDRRQPYP